MSVHCSSWLRAQATAVRASRSAYQQGNEETGPRQGSGRNSTASAPAGVTQSARSDEPVSLSSFSGHDVFCLRSAENGSRIVLVGLVHGKQKSAESWPDESLARSSRFSPPAN